MDYLLAKVSLMVTGIALSKGPHFFFALLFFYLWALFKYFAPNAVPWGMEWYWLCILSESAIFACAVIVKPNARVLIIAFSTIQILANSFSLLSQAIYDYYPTIIRICEISQCIILIIWSPVALVQIEKVRNFLKGTRTWMLRLFKQVTT